MSWRTLFLLLIGFELCGGSNILIISMVASHSHSMWCNKLAQVLLQRGHKVTILDTDPPKKTITNLTTYTLEGAYGFTGNVNINNLREDTPKSATDLLFTWNRAVCETMMFSPTFKKFLAEHSAKEKPFDLIIHDMPACENFLGLVHHLGNPKLVGVTAFGESTSVLHVMWNHQNMIHSPLHMSPYGHPMSFKEKLWNFFYTAYYYYRYNTLINDLDKFSKKVFGDSTPHILHIARSTSLALVNAHPVLDGAKYLSPSVVHIGGFHIDEPKKLDAETQAFLDGAEHGAIYFSLGSNIRSADMAKDKITIILNVFRKLKQRVLWKFEDNIITDLPKNIIISRWFSQNDILAHPNMKIFITHCGLLGIQEAVYHGVPMIGMPFYIDQHFSAKHLEKKGILVKLLYSDLTESKLQAAIGQLLTDESYSIEMKRWSSIFRDRPTPPKELAAYWIEYVLKNDDLTFLQPPETGLSTFEIFIFDVKTLSGILIGLIIAVLCRSTYYKSNKRRYKKKDKKH